MRSLDEEIEDLVGSIESLEENPGQEEPKTNTETEANKIEPR